MTVQQNTDVCLTFRAVECVDIDVLQVLLTAEQTG